MGVDTSLPMKKALQDGLGRGLDLPVAPKKDPVEGERFVIGTVACNQVVDRRSTAPQDNELVHIYESTPGLGVLQLGQAVIVGRHLFDSAREMYHTNKARKFICQRGQDVVWAVVVQVDVVEADPFVEAKPFADVRPFVQSDRTHHNFGPFFRLKIFSQRPGGGERM